MAQQGRKPSQSSHRIHVHHTAMQTSRKSWKYIPLTCFNTQHLSVIEYSPWSNFFNIWNKVEKFIFPCSGQIRGFHSWDNLKLLKFWAWTRGPGIGFWGPLKEKLEVRDSKSFVRNADVYNHPTSRHEASPHTRSLADIRFRGHPWEDKLVSERSFQMPLGSSFRGCKGGCD